MKTEIEVANTFRPRGARRDHDPNGQLTFVRGQGAYLWDEKGRRYLDFISGYSSTLFGHAHPRLVRIATEQLATLTQLVGLNHPWREPLESKLACLSPFAAPTKVWLASTGARAVEIAWKLAYAYRPGLLVSFELAFHGRSIATSQLSDTARLPIVNQPVASPLPYPRCGECPFGLQPATCRAECFDDSEKWIASQADKISAVIVEPALGARGYYYAPSVFFQRLREVTRRFGISVIDDEVQMGLGRLGAMFACQAQGWEPDMVVLGKSLGGGMVPISAVLGRAEIMDGLDPGYESETFAANPLACRVALELLEILDQDGLLDRAIEIERWIRTELESLVEKLPVTAQFACQGASGMIEIDLKQNNDGPCESSPTSPASSFMGHWVEKIRDGGLLVHWTGATRNRIVLIPPLIVTHEQIKQAGEILKSAAASISCTLKKWRALP